MQALVGQACVRVAYGASLRMISVNILGKCITLWGERERGSVVGAVCSHRK